jgi:Amt family ammonium transporter
MSSSAIYQSCAGQFDSGEQLDQLLQCLSTGHDGVSKEGNGVGSSFHSILTFNTYHPPFAVVQALSDQTSNLAGGIDAFYLIFAGALVYFMQTGFAMLCAGSIRAKNVKNVILWNLLDSCGGGLAFWSVGYAFAYGGDNAGSKTFVGNAGFFLQGDDIRLENWFFQFAFACALSSIVAGTVR